MRPAEEPVAKFGVAMGQRPVGMTGVGPSASPPAMCMVETAATAFSRLNFVKLRRPPGRRPTRKEIIMVHEHYEHCSEACHECRVACEHCATACLAEPDVKKMARCIALDRSCADICGLAIGEMARGSDFADRICQLCAEMCDACGEECGRHRVDHCQECAAACRKCAEACREMAGAGHGGRGRGTAGS